MDLSKALLTIDLQISAQRYVEAEAKLIEASRHINTNIFVPFSSKYNPQYCNSTAMNAMELKAHHNSHVKNGATHFLEHWYALYSTYSPNDFISFAKTYFSETRKKYVDAQVLIWFTRTVEKLPQSQQKSNLELCQQMILRSDPENLTGLSESFLKLIKCNLSENEIKAFIIPIENPKTAYILAYLVDPFRIMTEVAFNVSVALVQFLDQRHLYDFSAILEKIKISIENLEATDRIDAIELLTKLMYRFKITEDIEVWSHVYQILEQDIGENTECIIIDCLLAAYERGFIKDKDVLPLIKFSESRSDRYNMLMIHAGVKFIDEETIKSTIVDYFLFIASTKNAVLNVQVMKYVRKFYNKFKEVEIIEYINRLCVPLFLDDDVRIQIAKFILSKQSFYFTNLMIRFDVSQLAINLIDNDPSEKLLQLAKNIFDMHGIPIYFPKFDWLGGGAAAALQICDIDVSWLMEILSCGILEPHQLHVAFKILQKFPEEGALLTYPLLIAFCYNLVKEMGADPDEEFKTSRLHVKVYEDHEWASQSDLKLLHAKMETDITESEYGKLIVSVLQTISVLKHHTQSSYDQIAQMIYYLRVFANSLGDIAYTLLAEFNSDFKNLSIKTPDSICLMIKRNIDRTFKQFKSFKSAINITEAAVECIGDEAAIRDLKEYVYEAIATSRKVAFRFASVLTQPLPLMPTFLSFRDEPKHRLWMIECRKYFKFEEWVLEENDYMLIKDIPDVEVYKLDAIHKKVYQRISRSYIDDSTYKPSKPMFTSRSFRLRDISLGDGFVFHKGLDDSFFTCISYLWFSNLPLPSEMKAEELEFYCITLASDIRISIGYLSYALKYNLPVTVEKWIPKLRIQKKVPRSLYAAGLLLHSIHCKFTDLSEQILDFIRLCLNQIEIYSLDKDEIVNALAIKGGYEWTIVHGIVQIDPSYFEEYPSVIIEFCENKQRDYFLKLLIDEIEPKKYLTNYSAIISQVFYEDTEIILKKFLPANHEHFQKLFAFKYYNTNTKPRASSDFIDSYINFLTKSKPGSIPVAFYSLPYYLDLPRSKNNMVTQQVQRCLQQSPEFIRYLINENIRFGRFLQDKPPSFHRCYMRITKTPGSLPYPIFPEFAYKGIKVDIWKGSPISTRLRIGHFNTSDIIEALKILETPMPEAIEIYSILMSLDSKTLLLAKKWTNIDMAKNEMSHKLMEAACQNDVYTNFAREVFFVINKHMSIEYLAAIMCNKIFTNYPNFLSVCYLLLLLENEARRQEKQNLIDMVISFKADYNELFEDERRKSIFSHISDTSGFSELISYSQKCCE